MGRKRTHKSERTPPVCTYCGKPEPETRDHVPPRCIFPPNLPKGINLVTVPCCRPCNEAYGRFDERFQLLAAMRDTDGSRAARDVRSKKILKSIHHPAKKAYWSSIRREARRVHAVTPSGLWAGSALALSEKVLAVPALVDKIVRGLYFHDYMDCQGRLPDGYTVSYIGRVDGVPTTNVEKIACAVHANGIRTVVPAVFEYGCAEIAGPPEATVWFLRFYDTYELGAIVSPADGLGAG